MTDNGIREGTGSGSNNFSKGLEVGGKMRFLEEVRGQCGWRTKDRRQSEGR